MDLIDIFRMGNPPLPWSEGETFPWHDPGFSQRILKEHISQKHDAASRRTVLVKKHIHWIHENVLCGKASRILDLACGPGLYTNGLAMLGHVPVGIDLSPAAIAYASEHAGPNSSHILGDMHTTMFGSGFDLVMLTYGEFNALKPQDALTILQKAYKALKAGGTLLMEVITFDAVFDKGNQPPGWYRAEKEFFADAPYLCLTESFWDEANALAMERYNIVDVATAKVNCYVNSSQAYTDQQYRALLRNANFDRIQVHPSLTGKKIQRQEEMIVLLAKKKEKMR